MSRTAEFRLMRLGALVGPFLFKVMRALAETHNGWRNLDERMAGSGQRRTGSEWPEVGRRYPLLRVFGPEPSRDGRSN